MPSQSWQCAECKAWSWNSRALCGHSGKHWNFSKGRPKKMVKKVSQQEAAPLSAEELVEDAPRERVVATRREIKGKSASLATPQSTRAAVERRADQVRQRLREIDPMSLGTAKVQSAIGREEEQHKKKNGGSRASRWWRTCACFPRKRQTRVEDSMDQREDYDGWGWWHRRSSTGDYWGHREPQESASPTLAGERDTAPFCSGRGECRECCRPWLAGDLAGDRVTVLAAAGSTGDPGFDQPRL